MHLDNDTRTQETPKMNEIDSHNICTVEVASFSPATQLEELEIFMVFSTLPIELRRNIWSFAMPGPRVMEFEWHGTSSSLQPWAICPESAERSPVLFQVNQEAREEFLHHYRAIPPKICYGRSISFFNPLVDTLFLTPGTRVWQWMVLDDTLRLLDPTILEDLRYLAIQFDVIPILARKEQDTQPPWDDHDLSTIPEYAFVQERLHTLIRRSPKLVELSVVVGDFASEALRLNGHVKTPGRIDLIPLVPSTTQPSISLFKIENLRSWLLYFIHHLPRHTHPVVSIKQAVRRGELVGEEGIIMFIE